MRNIAGHVPGEVRHHAADQPAFIMATSGEVVTYGEYEARTNRLAHLLRDQGLQRLDHYSIFMENNARYLEMCGAGERSGLYYTCINSHLTADELAYIVNNSESRVFITSREKLDVARDVVALCPARRALAGRRRTRGRSPVRGLPHAPSSGYPDTPIADERQGAAMLYSSGTTGRPKGIMRQLADVSPSEALALMQFLIGQWRYREGQTYLSPAPLYHSAPQGAVGLTIRVGGTAIIMERFDPEQYLQLVEQYRVTHSQLVPTMFNRMLKLPDEVRSRYDLSSLETVVHAAAPCPIPVKEQMIEWWGPVIIEYYAATEGIGYTTCDSARVAGPQGHGRAVQARRAAHPRRRVQRGPERHAGHDLVRVAGRAQLLEGPGEDEGGDDAGREDEHDRRRRLRRRRRLAVPHRPQVVHDHLRRREHLPAGDREPPRHPPQGRRRGRVRRAPPGPRRGGQGRRPADARRRSRRPSSSGS